MKSLIRQFINPVDALAKEFKAQRWDAATLADLAEVMGDASICGLGQAAPNPIRCIQKYFPHEVGEAPWTGALPRPVDPAVAEHPSHGAPK